jgi:3-oxoacyl-[acyl-carrier protein] reductase
MELGFEHKKEASIGGKKEIGVHLKGVFFVTRSAVAIMQKQNSGRIINVTSHSGLQGNMGQTNYGAAKAGIAGFTLCAALDLAKYNIAVNAIAPMAWTRMVASIPGFKEPPLGSTSSAWRL